MNAINFPEYHKIQTLFKRNLELPKKPMIEGDWTTPELKYLADNEWEFTEKVDGTNTRIHWEPVMERVTFGGRTDNAQIPVRLLNYLQEAFHPSVFVGAAMPHMTLFGEGYGPGIQSGGLYRGDQAFVLFDVVVHSEDQDWWLQRLNVEDIADKLSIDSVPVIGQGTLYDAIDKVKYGLTSEWGDFEAEGIVARPSVPMFDRKGQRIITKIKGRDFK